MGQISGEVNRLARELTRRAADNDAYEGERYEDLSCKDQALTYHEITSHYRSRSRHTSHMFALRSSVWMCPTHSTTQLSTPEAWQAVITSNDYNIQLQAVQRARDIATSLRLPAPSWAEPPR
ncbi:hypothetical protein HPB50_028777 [Hyalomma asiaticum]|nr:hypothetical protein HPB50_028777 [Hyalomma asiaticum]